MIEEVLPSLIQFDVAITSLIGQKFYPFKAPQNTPFPIAVYQRVETGLNQTLDGANALTRGKFQVQAIAKTFTEAKSITAAFRRKLHGYRGTVGTTTIQGIFAQDERDEYVVPQSDDDTGWFVTTLDLQIWFTEN